MYRQLIAEAYNADNQTLSSFRREVRRRANLDGLSPSMIFFLIKLAVWCYKLWKDLDLTKAPVQPVAGEPDFDAEMRDA